MRCSAARRAHLLLPRVDLGAVFPTPPTLARQHGATTAWRIASTAGARRRRLAVDGEALRSGGAGLPAREAARLARRTRRRDWAADGGAGARSDRHRLPRGDGCALPAPMLALRSRDDAPAQFVFDRGQLGGPRGLLACVIRVPAAPIANGCSGRCWRRPASSLARPACRRSGRWSSGAPPSPACRGWPARAGGGAGPAGLRRLCRGALSGHARGRRAQRHRRRARRDALIGREFGHAEE